MEKFDFRDKGYIILILGILLIFVLVVSNAYKYIPSQDLTTNQIKKEYNNVLNNIKNISNKNEQEKDSIEGEGDGREEYIEETSFEQNLDLEDDVIGTTIPQENSIESILKKAVDYKTNNQLNSAIYEYEKALELSGNNYDKALCYDELAIIYANQKRYLKALEMAKQAYELLPNTNREFFIARLEYKMGNIEKAEISTKNILMKEFSINDK